MKGQRHHRSRQQLRLVLVAAFVCISTTSLHPPQPMPTTLHSAARLRINPRISPGGHVARLRGGAAGGVGEAHSLRFFCGTWNVNGKAPSVPLEEWLFPRSDGDDVDVYVIGLQEVQDLTGTQALITDEEKGRQWSMNIQRTLGAPNRYQFVAARQMVGVYLCVLVRTELVPFLSDLRVMELGTGFLQQGGNKGGVAARFTLHGARICVVSSHLAAQTSNTDKRNKDYRELVHRLDFNLAEDPPVKEEDLFAMPDIGPPIEGAESAGSFPAAKSAPIKKTRSGVFGSAVNLKQLSSLWDSAKKDAEGGEKKPGGKPAQEAWGILDHDLVLWVGDLNYRFNLPEQAVLGLIGERNWSLLYEFDQLNIAKKAGDSFHSFVEPPLLFVPTYKYERWGTGFARKEEGKGLKRAPAWCDRVLYRHINPLLHVQAEAYRRHEVLGSDHRPVSALLHVTLPPSAALATARADVKIEDVEEADLQSEVEGLSSVPVESDAEGWAVLPQKRGSAQEKQRAQLELMTQHALMPAVSNLTASVALYDTSSEILLVPTSAAGGAALCVDKRTQSAQWLAPTDAALRRKTAKLAPKQMVHGTLGMAKLSFATYLVVVTKVAGIGSLDQGAVHAVTETEVLPVSVGPPVPESEEEKRAVDDREYGMLKDMIVGWNLFFSRDFDATQTQQRLQRGPEDGGRGGMDGPFVWNANMLSHLGQAPGDGQAPGHGSLVLIPAVCGFFLELETEIQQQKLKLALISRRSRHRAGVRFFSRGIDADGHVSNFVETEQVLMSDAGTSSYVVIRGSIPLFWQEGEALVTLKPTPTLVKDPPTPHHEAMGKHLRELAERYKRVSMLSLIDTSGVEGPISQSFKSTAAAFVERGSGARQAAADAPPSPAGGGGGGGGEHAGSDVAFREFDFHKECGKTASAAAAVGVAKLLDSMEGMRPDNLFLRRRAHGAGGGGRQGGGGGGGGGVAELEQGTVFRVNCIDCLDRTNVVQAALASRMLIEQLMAHALVEPGEYEACMFAAKNGYVPPLPLMSKMLRGMWADMGDAVSVQYAGTGALKGDFTRSGKRTIKGIFSDGIANVKRAMQNNFADVYRQQVLDLIHGVAVRSPGQRAPPLPLRQDAVIDEDMVEDVDLTDEEEGEEGEEDEEGGEEEGEEDEEEEEGGAGEWEEGAETGEDGSLAAEWEGAGEQEWDMGRVESEDHSDQPPMYT